MQQVREMVESGILSLIFRRKEKICLLYCKQARHAASVVRSNFAHYPRMEGDLKKQKTKTQTYVISTYTYVCAYV